MSHSQPLDSHSHVPDIPDIPDPSPHLRQLLGLGPDEEVNLYALPDPPPGERPNYPLPTLIKLAIFGSPRKRLTLQEIYAALQERFEWFRDNVHDKSWQNSIRHNLSLNLCFRKVFKPATEPGKGYYWMVDYSNGEGNKRPRKR
ncbi:winged helix DNA-binding domain-containing protein, partial [Laetiporus sulphureus 93-53]